MMFRFKQLLFYSMFLISVLNLGCSAQKSSIKKAVSTIDSNKRKDGKCYSKCLMPDIYNSTFEEYFVYTGKDLPDKDDNLKIEIIKTRASTKWVSKKGDKKCLSPDPEDCLVWCLVEVPARADTIIKVIDTTLTRDFEIKEIEIKKLEKAGGYTEYQEVLCESQQTPFILSEIQEELRKREYYDSTITSTLDIRTKAALTKFQKDHSLPVGQLDLETINLLGVEIPN